MSLATAARLARRELRAGLRGFYIFLACLALGVAAIAGVGTVRTAIQAGLDREGAALLGGDAEIELTYRYANEDELAWMTETALRVSEVVDFRSMAVVGDERALTQVKAVDDLYPLIGTMQLDPAMPLDQALEGIGTLPGGVMAKALADRFGLVAGDTFRLGSQDFTLSAIITREPDDAGAGFSLGPRTLVRSVDLATSGLLGPGTLFETKYRLDLPDTADLEVTEQEARDVFSASGIRWRDSRNGAPGVERFVNRLGSFLVIVGLSGLAVGGVGVSAAVQAYLQRKTGVIATLKTLGATRSTIFQSYFLQVMAIAVIGIALGLIIGAGLPLALAPLITASLPIPAEFAIYPMPLIEAAIYGILTALLFTLIPLARTEAIRPATLFRDALGGKGAWPRPAYLIATALLVALLVGTAVSFSDAPTLTLWTALGIAAALLVLFGAAKGIIALSRRLSRHAHGLPALRWALAAIGGPRQEATSVVLSLGLGLSVLAAVGQIDGNLRYAIARDLPERAPSYFFVDIQTDQLDGFLQRVETDPSVTKVDTAPMLRGVVTQINDVPALEVAPDHWVVRGDRGITYADKLPERTIITEGEYWPEGYDGPPQISFAAEEAEEIGLKLGDTLTINVLGRDIKGTITSFRQVDFSNAGIGFVLTMNPAALRGAPHTHIATVYSDTENEAQILRDLATAYPNITAIRVRDAVERVAEVLKSIAAAASYGAGMTLLTGFLVLLGASAAGEPGRTYEAAVLKTLGATRARILSSFAIRSMIMGAAAGLVALIAGITAGWAVSIFVMETDFTITWSSAILIVLGGIFANLAAGFASAWRSLRVRPARVLRAKD